MKIVINRGSTHVFTRVEVFKNGKITMVCPIKKDHLEFDAKEGDKIEIKLAYNRFLRMGIPSAVVASFVCHEGDDALCIHPTMLCKIWEYANYALPWFSILFFAVRSCYKSVAYDWLCAGLVVFAALSFIFLKSCTSLRFMLKRLYKLEKL